MVQSSFKLRLALILSLLPLFSQAGIVEDFIAIRDNYLNTKVFSVSFTHQLFMPDGQKAPFYEYQGLLEVNNDFMFTKLGDVEVFSGPKVYIMIDYGLKLIVIADPQPIQPMPVNPDVFFDWIVDWDDIPAADGERGYKVFFSRYFDSEIQEISFYFNVKSLFFSSVIFHYKRGVKTDEGFSIGKLIVTYSPPVFSAKKTDNDFQLSNFVSGSSHNLKPVIKFSDYEIQDSRNDR